MEDISELPISEFAAIILTKYGETQIGAALIIASGILETEANKKPQDRDDSNLSSVKYATSAR